MHNSVNDSGVHGLPLVHNVARVTVTPLFLIKGISQHGSVSVGIAILQARCRSISACVVDRDSG